MLQRIVELALGQSGCALADLQDARFSELLAQGQSAAARANNGSCDTDVLPLRLGVGRFGLLMNTLGVAQARRIACIEKPCGLSSSWAMERAWFVRFGEFLLAQAEAHLPKTIQSLIDQTLSFGGSLGPLRDCLDPMLFEHLTDEARAARKIERACGDSPDETVLPWLCGGETLQAGPSCLGYALFTAAVLRRLNRKLCLLNVPLNGGWLMSRCQGEVAQDLLSFARNTSMWLPESFGQCLSKVAALEIPLEGHVAVASLGSGGSWELHDAYLRQFPIEPANGDLHLSQAVLRAYQRTGLSRFIACTETDESLAQSVGLIDEFKRAAAEAMRFISVMGSPEAVFRNLGRLEPASLFASADDPLKPGQSAGALVMVHLLGHSGAAGELYRRAPGEIRSVFHRITTEACEEGIRPSANVRLRHLERLALAERSFLETFVKRLPANFLTLAVRMHAMMLEGLRSRCRHPEAEVVDAELGFGALVLANVARNAGLSLEIEEILFEHCTLLERYMFWAERARQNGASDPRERFALAVLSKLPTRHPEVKCLLSGRESERP